MDKNFLVMLFPDIFFGCTILLQLIVKNELTQSKVFCVSNIFLTIQKLRNSSIGHMLFVTSKMKLQH